MGRISSIRTGKSSARIGSRAEAVQWACSLLSGGEFVVLDSETTGLGTPVDFVEVGVVSRSGEALFDSLIRPSCPMEPGASRIHGHTVQSLAGERRFLEVYPDFLDVLWEKRVVVYNASYDRRVWDAAVGRLVVRTFKERLFNEIFPGRTDVPKTLVFAKDDSHADDITRIVREEFAKGNDFCQKITYRTTSKKPEELLQEFRNSYNPRIAVSVDMIATGTDVKPLECLLFMRNVRSANYFEQMKGRGSRVINRDDLKSVTPDAEAKTRFVIVDAVGLTEEERSETQPLERQPSVAFDKVMQAVAMGNEHPDVVSTLASRLTRLERKLGPEGKQEISDAAGGKTLGSLSAALVHSLDPDAQAERAAREAGLPPGEEPTEEQLDAAERAMISEVLAPFHDPALRTRILEVQRAFEQVIDETTPDELLAAGFDEAAKEKARAVVDGFESFIEENREEIEALRLLYSRPRRAGLRYAQIKELAQAIKRPPLAATPELVWRAYEALEPAAVRGGGGSPGGRKLADVISLVRHALDPAEPLEPYAATVEERYEAWMEEQEQAGATFTPDQRRWLDAIRDHVATALRIEREDFDDPPFNQLGGLGRVHQVFGDRLPQILDELNERLAA